MLPRALIALALAASFALAPLQLAAQSDDHAGHAVLGEVHFPVTCSPPAQAAFDQGMRLQHSFWYAPAREAFRQALAEDPSCVMAYWGQALSALNNPFNPPLAANLREGNALLQQARAVKARSQREADYIAALSLLFTGDDVRGQPARMARYRDAMAALHARYPDDSEAAIAYALSLIMATSPVDKTYADRLAAAGILEREFARQPQHPGVAHYLIHAYDVPTLAARGVPAAERYAAIAPDSPHALHMPSHIFTRVGRWEDSIATNRRSADTALAHGEVTSALHAMDYMVYAYLQTAQTEAARQVVEQAAKFVDWSPEQPIAGGYALAAIPARYALERGDWAAAASLTTRIYGVPYVDATTHFARAVGAARSGDPGAARVHIKALRAAAAQLNGTDPYWQGQLKILCFEAEGWTAFASGHRKEGLKRLVEASDREDKTEKPGISPGPLAPAREQLAEMLLQAGRSAEARRQFEAVLRNEPRRLRAVWGAARSAALAGDKEAAARRYTELVEIAAPAKRPDLGLVVASTFLDAQ